MKDNTKKLIRIYPKGVCKGNLWQNICLDNFKVTRN